MIISSVPDVNKLRYHVHWGFVAGRISMYYKFSGMRNSGRKMG
jgi:hypothetical protein